METVGIISRDEWLALNPQPEKIKTLLERHDFVKFMDAPVVLDNDNAITARIIRAVSMEDLLGMLETTSFSHIYQIAPWGDREYRVRGQPR